MARTQSQKYELKEDDGQYGPAMEGLSPRQRAYVLEFLLAGGRDRTGCARRAGYGGPETTKNAMYVASHRLANDEKIIAAITEETTRRMYGNVALALKNVEDVLKADDASNKDKLAAAKMVFDRGGIHARTEHVVTVENVTTEAQIKRVVALARAAGKDPQQVLALIGIEYTPFEVVEVEK